MRNQRTVTPGVKLAKPRTVRLAKDTDAALVALAAERGITVAALVTELLTKARGGRTR